MYVHIYVCKKDMSSTYTHAYICAENQIYENGKNGTKVCLHTRIEAYMHA